MHLSRFHILPFNYFWKSMCLFWTWEGWIEIEDLNFAARLAGCITCSSMPCAAAGTMIEQQQLNFAASLFGCIRSSQGDRIDTWLCTRNPAIDISKNASHKWVIIHHNSHSFSVRCYTVFTCHLFRLDTVTGRIQPYDPLTKKLPASSSPVQ